MIRRIAISLLLVAACVAQQPKTGPAISGNLDDFDAFMAKAMQDFKIPGAAVAVVKDGKVILAKGYGYRDAGHKLPVTVKTVFPIASITKSFTVSSLGTLVDQGKVDWDTPVREYLPDFRMYDPVATDQLTPRDLVTHRSGLPRHDLLWYSSSFTQKQLIDRLRYLEPNRPLRSTFQYNNLMFLTAGYLGGHVNGGSWEDLVRQRILAPLGMTGTYMSSIEARKAPEYALPYRKVRKSGEVHEIDFAKWGDVGPAGAINSNLEDMSRYLLMHVNKGKVEGKQLLAANTATQMQTPQMAIQGASPFPELSETSYGMGFFISSYRGHKYVDHGGNLDGFSLQLGFLPNEGIGVVVLCNLDGTPFRDLVPYYVFDRLLGMEPVDWSRRYLDLERKGKDAEAAAEQQGITGQRAGTRPSHQASEYEGDFEHPGYGRITVRARIKDDFKGMEMTLNDIHRPLEHFHYDTFQVPANPLDPFEKLRLTFQTDPQGDLSSLSATLDSNVKDIVFQRVAEQRMFEASFLGQFTGVYDIGAAGWTISLVGGNALELSTPGAPARKLIPRHGTRFDVQGATGLSIEFKQDSAGKTNELVLYGPRDASIFKKK
ncbi:MAG TPA: serine hydrolase [Candidatus Saccharimonadales bacterium]|nr:serine hydrolase [Candidatus Saccharimonadales bacterium]